MKIYLKPSDPVKFEVDILWLFVFQEELKFQLSQFPSEIQKLVGEASIREDFQGKEGQSLIVSARGIVEPYKISFLGLGAIDDFNLEKLYTSIALSVRKSKDQKAVKIGILSHKTWFEKFDTFASVKTISEAVQLANYRFILYKSDEERQKLRSIEEVYISIPAAKIRIGEDALDYAKVTADGVNYARDLINEPSQVTTPQYLASEAVKISKNSKGLVKTTILEITELSKLGLNAFLAVAKGSDQPPKFIVMKYKPSRPKKKVAIIGKGITFDTGGLSLKSAEHMETMKLDMSGAAAVLAVFQALPHLQPSIEVVGLIPACENMPSGKALKPGDILKSYCGKTIEVVNTDAEGRLTLADAISYAVKKEHPDEIIDLATLTGACQVALGQDIAGLWGNDLKYTAEIEKVAQISGEKVHHMPLEDSYKELIKSHIADIKNTQTGKYAGAITAALFLQEFVGKIPWVHLDIAGPAFMEKDTPLNPQGGAGFGVRIILSYLTGR